MRIANLQQLDSIIETACKAARVPGAGIAVVAEGRVVLAKGYGYRSLQTQMPMTADTIYPIASTTKAMNATLLGMLVDEGKLAWDEPVQTYLPAFRFSDPLTSAQITLRDLVTMRTGLPRHDWLWMENPIERADLVMRLRYLEPSAGLRERFQYNNLTVTAAGHIAEVVTGQSWEDLIHRRLLEPLGMRSTGFGALGNAPVTSSYHEDTRRELIETTRLSSDVTTPSGGAIHSTVLDMASWVAFNLNGGTVGERRLIRPQLLAEIYTPQMVVGSDPAPPTPNAPYALGWFVDTYNGCARISHGGYLHDVNSEVMLFPGQGIGVVSLTNFGPPRLARLLGQHAFDLLMGFEPVQQARDVIAAYEVKVEQIRRRDASLTRVRGTSPSHELCDYAGMYLHAGYGQLSITTDGTALVLMRNDLMLPLEHWHYDCWAVAENDRFVIHLQHAFDRASRILFETNADGAIHALSIPLEPAVAPIRFEKQQARPT